MNKPTYIVSHQRIPPANSLTPITLKEMQDFLKLVDNALADEGIGDCFIAIKRYKTYKAFNLHFTSKLDPFSYRECPISEEQFNLVKRVYQCRKRVIRI